MSVKDKFGPGYGTQIHERVLSYENEVLESVFDSRSSDAEDSHVNDRLAKVEEMHAVPPPMIEIYMPHKSDFRIDDSKFTYGPKQSKTSESDAKTSDLASCESNSSVETLESVPKQVESKPKAVREPKVWSDAPIIKKIIHTKLLKKGIVDSGCSGHMNGNKAYLVEYQDFNGGPVAFGGGKGQITENIVPSGDLACLIANATIDESNKWHRRVLVTKPQNKTPYELITGKIPIISYIRPFGCHVTILNTIDHLGKFEEKLDEGFLVGYSLNSKAFRVYNLETKRVEENLHINFLENKPNVAGKGPTSLFDLDYLTDSINYQPVTAENKANKIAGQKEAITSVGTQDNIDAGNSKLEAEHAQKYFVLPLWSSYTSTVKSSEAKNGDPKLIGDTGAARVISTNYVNTASTPVNTASTPVNTASTPVNTASPSRNIPSLEDICEVPNDGIFTSASYDDEGAVADFTNLESIVNIKPKKISQALKDESWVDAMQEELLEFKTQQVWILVDLPFRKKVIGTKWVYRNKKDERGVVAKNKARLVAQGHRQEEGIDYDEVFALVARIEVIRIFLASASYIGFIVYQMDMKSAFLYGKINEEVYVSPPLGFIDPKFPKKVKSGYRRGLINNTLFIEKDKKDIMLVQVYVDDIIFGSTKKSWCDEFEALMKSKFQMSSIEILKKFDFMSVKNASTSIKTKKPLVKDAKAADVDIHLYRSVIGSLMYLTASRPDIMYAVYACSRFQVTPKTSHLYDVKRIFRYLKGQPKLGLWYPRGSAFDLKAYSDSDYARANLNRKSITGGCQFLGRRLISWQCKKQTIVATSTTEAKYVVVASCCGQVLWIQNQMLDYAFNFINTKIYIDNESTICIVKNLVFHSKTTHIEIRHHFIRDAYEKKLI
nr:putative ribonuclease H-like domain-containing protein [Tanacetum cinerariifolium]